MALPINYNTLFEIYVYHDYFLDDGSKKFSAMTNDADRLKQLSRYDLFSYLDIYPTKETQRLLKNQKMLMIRESDRFRIVVSTEADEVTPLIPISGTAEMKFCIGIKDSYFDNYTDLNLLTNRIFLFTNVSPYTGFPLITIPDTDVPPQIAVTDNTFLANAATSDALLKTLSQEERIGLFGMFSIRMKTGDPAYDVIDSNNHIKSGHARFGVHFLNIKRVWKYKKNKDNTSFVTKDPQPLVKYGFVELTPTDFIPIQTPVTGLYYPNAGVASFEESSGVIYSVIFI